MAKFAVNIQVVKTFKEPLTIYAANANEAKAKAEELVAKWDGIDEVQAFHAEETP